MVVQISPEEYYDNLSGSLVESTPSPTVIPQRMPYSTQSLVDAVPTADSGDKFLIFGVVAVMGMVALCFLAYTREQNKNKIVEDVKE